MKDETEDFEDQMRDAAEDLRTMLTAVDIPPEVVDAAKRTTAHELAGSSIYRQSTIIALLARLYRQASARCRVCVDDTPCAHCAAERLEYEAGAQTAHAIIRAALLYDKFHPEARVLGDIYDALVGAPDPGEVGH